MRFVNHFKITNADIALMLKSHKMQHEARGPRKKRRRFDEFQEKRTDEEEREDDPQDDYLHFEEEEEDSSPYTPRYTPEPPVTTNRVSAQTKGELHALLAQHFTSSKK